MGKLKPRDRILEKVSSEQSCGQKAGECEITARRAGAAINHLIRMRHLLMTGT